MSDTDDQLEFCQCDACGGEFPCAFMEDALVGSYGAVVPERWCAPCMAESQDDD